MASEGNGIEHRAGDRAVGGQAASGGRARESPKSKQAGAERAARDGADGAHGVHAHLEQSAIANDGAASEGVGTTEDEGVIARLGQRIDGRAIADDAAQSELVRVHRDDAGNPRRRAERNRAGAKVHALRASEGKITVDGQGVVIQIDQARSIAVERPARHDHRAGAERRREEAVCGTQLKVARVHHNATSKGIEPREEQISGCTSFH